MTSKIQIHPEGPTFSRLVHGFMRLCDWGISPPQRLSFIEALLALGITTFDHADIYGGYTCERLFGEALALHPSLREKMQLVTKTNIALISENRPNHRVHHYDTSKAHIIASVENSLRNLRTDRIDLLLIHRPDPLMNADETAEALTELRESGKILFAGVSNFLPLQFELLQSRLEFPLVTNQIEYSVLNMEHQVLGTLDDAQKRRLAPMAWSPFGGGRLFRGGDEKARRVRAALERVGSEAGGASPDQIALAFILRHPANMLPVLGTGNLDRIRSALNAGRITLDRQQWFAIWEASMGHEVP